MGRPAAKLNGSAKVAHKVYVSYNARFDAPLVAQHSESTRGRATQSRGKKI